MRLLFWIDGVKRHCVVAANGVFQCSPEPNLAPMRRGNVSLVHNGDRSVTSDALDLSGTEGSFEVERRNFWAAEADEVHNPNIGQIADGSNVLHDDDAAAG